MYNPSMQNALPPLNVPELLRAYGLRPDKRLGQNFLVDPAALQRVVDAAGLSPHDAILEIGPGLGGLTRYLARAGRQVVAVELDERLLPPLHEVLKPYPNVRVVHGDILELDPAELMAPVLSETDAERPPGYVVAANIPYYITSPLIRHLLESQGRPAPFPPQRLTLTVQLEVAERICAGPGEMSLLAIGVQVYGRPQVAARIPAGAFYPVPKVDSAVVRVEIYHQPLIPPPALEQLFRLAKAGFSQKRKMLRNALASGLGIPPAQVEALLRSAAIDPTRRAETLSLEEWGQLAACWSNC
jgi:16S rRNA (adenine1518-N6/adenine1519-N6)-dimethyltransferase